MDTITKSKPNGVQLSQPHFFMFRSESIARHTFNKTHTYQSQTAHLKVWCAYLYKTGSKNQRVTNCPRLAKQIAIRGPSTVLTIQPMFIKQPDTIAGYAKISPRIPEIRINIYVRWEREAHTKRQHIREHLYMANQVTKKSSMGTILQIISFAMTISKISKLIQLDREAWISIRTTTHMCHPPTGKRFSTRPPMEQSYFFPTSMHLGDSLKQ